VGSRLFVRLCVLHARSETRVCGGVGVVAGGVVVVVVVVVMVVFLLLLLLQVYPDSRTIDDAFQRLLMENILPLASRRYVTIDVDVPFHRSLLAPSASRPTSTHSRTHPQSFSLLCPVSCLIYSLLCHIPLHLFCGETLCCVVVVCCCVHSLPVS
jgi:hypothetical protein